MFIFVFGLVTFGLGWALFWLLSPASVVWALFYYGMTLGSPASATLGMRAMEIEMRTWYGAPAYFVLGAVHAIVYWISVSVLTPLVLLVGFFNARRRLLHDMLVGAVIINNAARAAALRVPTERLMRGFGLCRANILGQSRRRAGPVSAAAGQRASKGRAPVTQHSRDTPQFYLTAPSPCPYLAGKEERKVFTHLVGERAGELNNILTQGGFRRSQSIAYRPACEGCRCCVSVRVHRQGIRPHAQHAPHRRAQRRHRRRDEDRGADLRAIFDLPRLSRFASSRRRHGRHDGARLRHDGRGQPHRDPHHRISAARTGHLDDRDARADDLIAVALTDVLDDGLSMVYSFFEPDEAARSLGTFMVLDHIARAQRMGLAYVYLGYWVRGSRKMDYKSRFLPQERLTPDGWARVE